MRHSPSRIGRLIHQFRPERWLRRLLPRPESARRNVAHARMQSLLANTAREAAKAQLDAGAIATRMQEVIDHAHATSRLLPFLPGANIHGLLGLWGGVRGQVANVQRDLDRTTADSDLVSGTVSLTSASTTTIIGPQIALLREQEGFGDAWDNYVAVVSRPSLINEVRDLLLSFGLDRAQPAKKSCLELFDAAHAAYSQPASPDIPASTSLIPMRECIQEALDSLLRRRPSQEQTGSSEKAKVRSVARQLRRQGVAAETIDGWGDEWHRLNDEALSGSKRAALSREEWTLRLMASTRFLHSFLTGLDQFRLRG